MNDRIETGDLVLVVFTALPLNELRGRVVSGPQQTGDCWIIKEEWEHKSDSNGTIHYVQTFAEIILVAKPKQEETKWLS